MTSPSIVINIFYIKINSIENTSTFNVGQSLLADLNSSDKKTQGVGAQYGDESGFIGTKSGVDDRDIIDTPSQKISSPFDPNHKGGI